MCDVTEVCSLSSCVAEHMIQMSVFVALQHESESLIKGSHQQFESLLLDSIGFPANPFYDFCTVGFI